MSIVPLKKITICGLAEEAEKVTASLQESGILHIIQQTEKSDTEEDYSTATINENIKALMYLANCQNKLHMLKEAEDFNAEELIEEITGLRTARAELIEQQEVLEKEIKALSPWGNFEFVPKEEIEDHKFWFYIMPNYKVAQIPKKTIYSIINQVSSESYVLVLSKDRPHNMPTKYIKLDRRSLGKLQAELENINEQIDDIDTKRIALTKYRHLLAENLNDVNNEAKRLEVEYQSSNDGDIFMIKGYIGKNYLDRAKKIADEHDLALYVEEISDKDKAPTLLTNPEKIAGGEELVKFYSVPGYKALDPSNVLFFSFALFFAMIMSDFGYACVLGLILMMCGGKLKASQTGRRIKTLGWFIVFVSMAWGALIGSYFGMMPSGENIFSEFAQTFKKLDMNNINTMMKISIYVGIGHVCLANLLVAWRHKNSLYALSKIGWGLITISGAVYIPFIMMGDSATEFLSTLAQYSLITGISLVFLFTSHAKNIFRRILDGLLGLTKLSGAFGDVLSYLRIFALGLASASLGITFNHLAVEVIDAMPALGYIMAFIILLVGHTINFGLGIMSGVVHGLRLNVIEFFNWSISDEGYPFNAFSKMEVKKWIKL